MLYAGQTIVSVKTDVVIEMTTASVNKTGTVKTDAVIKMNVPVQTITVSKAGTVGTLSPFHSYTHARA